MINAIPVDSRGEPLQPSISWLDGRAGEQAQQIMRRLGGPKVFAALVGVALTGKDLLPKFLWIKRHLPEMYTRAAAIVDCSSYMLAHSTGRLVYEWSTASVTGLFNLKTKTWDHGMRFFGLDQNKFPEPVPSQERIGIDLPGRCGPGSVGRHPRLRRRWGCHDCRHWLWRGSRRRGTYLPGHVRIRRRNHRSTCGWEARHRHTAVR
jgi:hypothetical protein